MCRGAGVSPGTLGRGAGADGGRSYVSAIIAWYRLTDGGMKDKAA